jgi:hypothetical protein
MLPREPLAPMRELDPAQVRRSGWVLLVFGAVLLAIGGGGLLLALGAWPAWALPPGVTPGPPAQVPVPALVLLGFVAVFAVLSLVEGGVRIATSRRDPRRMRWLLSLAFVFLIAGLVARAWA